MLPKFKSDIPSFGRPFPDFRKAAMPCGSAPVSRREVACAAIVADEVDASGMLEVLDPSGHFEVRWGRKRSEVEAAEATFKDLLAKGYLAFKRTWRGRKGSRMGRFDPKARGAIFEMGVSCAECGKVSAQPGRVLCEACADKPKRLPVVAAAAKKDDREHVDAERVEDEEESYEQTREFDKKAKTTMTPPMRGG